MKATKSFERVRDVIPRWYWVTARGLTLIIGLPSFQRIRSDQPCCRGCMPRRSKIRVG